MKKKISILTPCYNEEGNVSALISAVREAMAKLPDYDYEHVLIDNHSTDSTWEILKKEASFDKRVKIIENERNFGPGRSGAHGFFATSGDATVCLACDFQDPPELIPRFIEKWESGYKVVWGKKTGSAESSFMFRVRSLYYKIIKKCSTVDQYEQVTGFGLYDKSVVDLMRAAEEPSPNFRNMIAEYGYEVALIEYVQPARKSGKSSYNFFSYLDTALEALVSTSVLPIKLAVFGGMGLGAAGFAGEVITFIVNIVKGVNLISNAFLFFAMCFFAGLIIFFTGMVGLYVSSVLSRVTKRPLAVEKERINFDEKEEK